MSRTGRVSGSKLHAGTAEGTQRACGTGSTSNSKVLWPWELARGEEMEMRGVGAMR